jgi:uncharacterized membrane protein
MLPLPDFDKTAIESAIKAAELRSTGEIKVYVERRQAADTMRRAKEIFEKLGIAATRDRAGVLLYVHLRRRELVVLGDVGINAKVQPGAWKRICDEVAACFQRGNMTVGVILGIMLAGDELARFFPCDGRTPQPNELSDAVVEGNQP